MRYLMRWVGLCLLGGWWLGWAPPVLAGPDDDGVQTLRAAQVLLSTDDTRPAADDARWQPDALPAYRAAPAAWFRVEFTVADRAPSHALYLPYLYGGGSIWLNGHHIAEVNRTAPGLRVRWERPHLLLLPPQLLRNGRNELMIHASAAHYPPKTILPRLRIGPVQALQTAYEWRSFVTRAMPVIAIALCLAGGSVALFVWWRRRSEVVYGYFGMAALSWAFRSTTFTIDTWRDDLWDLWRLLYYVGTGGLVIGLCLLALHQAGWLRPGLRRALLTYWALGPIAYLVGTDRLADGVWVTGLLPLGGVALVAAIAGAFKRRNVASTTIALTLLMTFVAGAHDLLLARDSALLLQTLPEWSAHRFFLLHHAATLMLAVMGATLAERFVRSLHALERVNATLEARVQAREHEIAQSYQRIATLEAARAAADERQRIMQELHDGLGSQLFAGLAQAERGDLSGEQMASLLRDSIAEMRLAIDALTSGQDDFRAVFGNFRYRWEPRLRDFGVQGQWVFDLPEALPPIEPHAALQLLRIAQESLTNVIKHARARTVEVRLALRGRHLQLTVQDDGRGLDESGRSGHGLRNMRARAQRLGAELQIGGGPGGTRVALELPVT
ncbi:sensor histidine kinase [Ideonella alba]|uniref:histidine kinase n=1 Tax=Ideonella alba TaxID=2824118 RepID=A0A941BJF4_9BURK|nr:sensor histidine kinase [Ideonella alba]MBQ0929029.1 sensor histidine kinase [Ideonella alba]